MNAPEVVGRILGDRARRAQCPEACAYAPANIALSKYWGKRDERLKLPNTGSISVSLADHGTEARLIVAGEDQLCINGEELAPEAPAARRMFAFLDLLRAPDCRLRLETRNTIPMGAGLASSASAFAAVTLAADRLFGWELDTPALSILARLGSGSACRSVINGFVEWTLGERADGTDSHAVPLRATWEGFRIGLLTLNAGPKPVGSTEAMKRTVETAALYQSWPAQVARDLPRIRQAIHDGDLATLGQHAEQNAMAMHATMIASWPPILYWIPESIATLHRVQALRAEGLPVYATMDAGPNVKLIFDAASEADLRQAFPGLDVIQP